MKKILDFEKTIKIVYMEDELSLEGKEALELEILNKTLTQLL